LLTVSDVVPDDLHARIRAALAGAAAGERLAGAPTGVAQLLDAAESAAACDGLDLADLEARGLDAPPVAGPSALVLRATVYGLLTPLDRPRLRRSAHRSATLGGADPGTAMTAVAAAVLTADLLRFDVDWCLTRLHQTLLEEAPLALLQRLRPLPEHAALGGDADPGAALQVAITALSRADEVPDVLDELLSYGDRLGVALSLGGALAGARQGSRGDLSWMEGLPERVGATADALAARARARLPQSPTPATIESPSHDQH
jgi:hypothetical protein